MTINITNAQKSEYKKKRMIIQDMLTSLQEYWEPAESLLWLVSSSVVTPTFLDTVAELLLSAIEETKQLQNMSHLKKLSVSLIAIRQQEKEEREAEIGALVNSVDCLK